MLPLAWQLVRVSNGDRREVALAAAELEAALTALGSALPSHARLMSDETEAVLDELRSR